MRSLRTLALVGALALLTGCKDDGATVRSGTPAATAQTGSGPPGAEAGTGSTDEDVTPAQLSG